MTGDANDNSTFEEFTRNIIFDDDEDYLMDHCENVRNVDGYLSEESEHNVPPPMSDNDLIDEDDILELISSLCADVKVIHADIEDGISVTIDGNVDSYFRNYLNVIFEDGNDELFFKESEVLEEEIEHFKFSLQNEKCQIFAGSKETREIVLKTLCILNDPLLLQSLPSSNEMPTRDLEVVL
ncbi:hypothetical protein RND81_08G081800 [Saponaria officinalis]|uniref:Uncharacterized protein n=1 Tax=Saponaria officinalis TaxID=3572 RepID=A0AAW1J4T9_SAPOF